MFRSDEQLVEYAKCIDDETERLKFVMNYFLNTVQYDYVYLLIKGYLQESISKIGDSWDVVVNPFKKGKLVINNEEYDDSYCISYKIVEGESQLLNKIVEAANKCGGSYEEYKVVITKILEEELEKHLSNKEMISKLIHKFIKKLDNDKKNAAGKIVDLNGTKCFLNKDIKAFFIEYLLNPNNHFPPVVENGLLKSGVCQNFADYLVDLLSRVGIVAQRVDGTSELGHAWIAAIVDGKCMSVDLTRAIFIRDGFKGIPKGQKSEDWLINDFEETFKMQKTRTITGVGLDKKGNSIDLPFVMNRTNYDEKLLVEMIENSLKNTNNRAM